MRWAASDVSPSSHLAFHIPTLAGFLSFVCFVVSLLLCCVVCGVFVSSFASVWNPEFSAQLDLDDRQGFIASSAMQQKKKKAAAILLFNSSL